MSSVLLTCADMALPRTVTAAEAGQKLVAYLVRRLNTPLSCAHRWVRSGQVRINGKRCKPFDRLEEGDLVRVPPMAFNASSATQTHAEHAPPALFPPKTSPEASPDTLPDTLPVASLSGTSGLPLPPVVAESDEWIVFCKPAGLAVHPGTGHEDCLTARLERHFAGADFMPGPAHRLDKDTTGVLVVAKTYRALRRLQAAFADREHMGKEYLAWVEGVCPWNTPTVLRDVLHKGVTLRGERMLTQNTGREHKCMAKDPQKVQGKDASLTVHCLLQRVDTVREVTYSLVQIRLHTGRTHQIRVQLAARGFAVVGDTKYGVCRSPSAGLYLHACRLMVDDQYFEALPQWQGPWAVRQLPEPLACS